MEPEVAIHCTKCKKEPNIEYSNERAKAPCPYCGSFGKHIEMHVQEHIELHENLNLKSKRKGVKKPLLEIFTGNDYFKTKKEWVKKTRIIDRENNNYFEEVKDNDGNIIHKCEEPLTNHFEHGSAKKVIKKRKNTE